MSRAFRALLLSSCAVLVGGVAPAAMAVENSAIVDTPHVAEAIKRNAIVWDTRSAAAYKQGHIPGAVNIDDIGVVLRDENTEDYIALEDIEKLLGGAGIDPSREVVVYGAKADPYVYFGLVTLQYFGAPNAKVFHGGIEDWKSAGLPVAVEPTRLAPIALKLKTRPELLVDTAEVVKKLRDPGVQIVDARTPREYKGEDIRAIRGGHIPGAVPIHYMENWVDPDTQAKLDKKLVANKDGMNLKSREQLKALYARLRPEKETIVYCQSGIRASETATVLKELGFKKVRVYDSSWLGYGNTLDAPAESVTFFNVGLMQNKMRAMQKRVENLEKELAEPKAGR
jgi:thiosulfate/3-mercaptopyruvate sulfurtransferase